MRHGPEPASSRRRQEASGSKQQGGSNNTACFAILAISSLTGGLRESCVSTENTNHCPTIHARWVFVGCAHFHLLFKFTRCARCGHDPHILSLGLAMFPLSLTDRALCSAMHVAPCVGVSMCHVAGDHSGHVLRSMPCFCNTMAPLVDMSCIYCLFVAHPSCATTLRRANGGLSSWGSLTLIR